LRKENTTLPEYQDEISQSKGVEAMLKEADETDKKEASLESILSVGSEPVEKDLAKTSKTQTPVEERLVGLADKVSLDEIDVLEKRAKVYELTVQDFPMGDSSPGAEITLVRGERRYGSVGSNQVSWDKGFHITTPTLKVVSGIEGLEEIGEIQGLHLEGLEVYGGLAVRGDEDSKMAEADSSGPDVSLGAMIRCSV
jgi:hypothetical protein